MPDRTVTVTFTDAAWVRAKHFLACGRAMDTLCGPADALLLAVMSAVAKGRDTVILDVKPSEESQDA